MARLKVRLSMSLNLTPKERDILRSSLVPEMHKEDWGKPLTGYSDEPEIKGKLLQEFDKMTQIERQVNDIIHNKPLY